eukprot:2598531-Pleurochrysis_carterae.AAC.2
MEVRMARSATPLSAWMCGGEVVACTELSARSSVKSRDTNSPASSVCIVPTIRVGELRRVLRSALNLQMKRLTQAGASVRDFRKAQRCQRAQAAPRTWVCTWSESEGSGAHWPRRKHGKVLVWLRGAKAARSLQCRAGRAGERRPRVVGGACKRQPVAPAWNAYATSLVRHGQLATLVASGRRGTRVAGGVAPAGKGRSMARRIGGHAELVAFTELATGAAFGAELADGQQSVVEGGGAAYVAQQDGARYPKDVYSKEMKVADGCALFGQFVHAHDVLL